MQNLILETKNLSYSFKSKKDVLKDLNIQIELGAIYGFIGPNGAGKTTTIRLLLGLLNTKGKVHIFGMNFKNSREQILSQIGSMIEEPSLYHQLSAWDNLRISQKILNTSWQRIKEVLKIVGLENESEMKVKHFSLGMKQRLAIAQALINNPKLLILDEPTNGLDPQGIIEIRNLILKLRKEYNITVLISSHMLTEVEKLCTHVGIINNGDLVFQGTIEELYAKKLNSNNLLVEVANVEDACTLLNTFKPQRVNGNSVSIRVKDKATVAEINERLVRNNIQVFHLSSSTQNLEDLFIHLTKNTKYE